MTATSIEALIETISARFDQAPLTFGHGTDNAWDEAFVLVRHVTGVPDDAAYLPQQVTPSQVETALALCAQRIEQRVPLAYLLGRADYMGMEFCVTRDVLVPRSPIGYLLGGALDSWLPPSVNRVLDLCSGSGCLGILAAHLFPQAAVTLVELDNAALQVARTNIKQHQLQHRVTALAADVTGAWPIHSQLQDTRFDLVIANPPYVDAADMASLPREYQAEPVLGLAAGGDGLVVMHGVLQLLPHCLARDGVLVGEVGASAPALLRAYPNLPFIWPELTAGGEGVFVLEAGALSSHTGADE
ncbi:MAG: 50S ribosomal protein L3 N(5)-glutamine methyltransferase [Pseudomonadota bacterium]